MQPVGAFVFDLLVIGEDARPRWSRAIRALRNDPHLRLASLAEADRIDLVIVVDATPDAVRQILDGVPPGAPVVVCGGREPALVELADIVVGTTEPQIIVETVRWILGLPSWVAPARRAAMRRLMRG